MAIDIEHLACPTCLDTVFSGNEAYVCNRCDTYQHRRCWNEAGRCGGSDSCKGKPRDVVVVRLEAAGPTTSEIADEVEERLRKLVMPPLKSLHNTVAKPSDLEPTKAAVLDASRDTKARFSDLRESVDAGVRGVRELVSSLDGRVKELADRPQQEQGISEEDITRLVRETTARVDSAVKALEKQVESQLDGLTESLRSELRSELFKVQQAVEACRWDTAARRTPFPWDARPDDLFLMAAEPGSERSEKE